MIYNIMTKTELRKSLDFVNEERERLQEENERLKWDKEQLNSLVNSCQEEIRKLKENNMSYQEEMARTWKIADDYKSRIEKAVEYIENTPLYETTYDYNMEDELEIQNVSDETASNKLLDILNGRSDE